MLSILLMALVTGQHMVAAVCHCVMWLAVCGLHACGVALNERIYSRVLQMVAANTDTA